MFGSWVWYVTGCISDNSKCLYVCWIIPPASLAVLPRGPVRASPYGSSVTGGGKRSTWRKPAVFGRVKPDNTLLTCDQGNFNRTLVTEVRDTCNTTVLPIPQTYIRSVEFYVITQTDSRQRRGDSGGKDWNDHKTNHDPHKWKRPRKEWARRAIAIPEMDNVEIKKCHEVKQTK